MTDDELREVCLALVRTPISERVDMMRAFLRFADAATPGRVLALLDERDAARALAQRWEQNAQGYLSELRHAREVYKEWRDGRDAALAALRALVDAVQGEATRQAERAGESSAWVDFVSEAECDAVIAARRLVEGE